MAKKYNNKISELIKQNKTADLCAEIAQNPHEFRNPFYLEDALGRNQLSCAEILLQFLTGETVKNQLDLPLGIVPVTYLPALHHRKIEKQSIYCSIESIEGMELLKKYHVPLYREMTGALLPKMVGEYADAAETSVDSLQPTFHYERLIDYLLGEGFSLHAPCNNKGADQNFADYLLGKWADYPLHEEDLKNRNRRCETQKLVFLAKRGFDLRPAMDTTLYEEIAAGHVNSPQASAEISARNRVRKVAAPFQALARSAPAAFLAAAPHSPARKEAALVACSGGTLPALLHLAAKKPDEPALAEAAAYLDDFWRGEYKNSLRTAAATFARSAPAEETALTHWARG